MTTLDKYRGVFPAFYACYDDEGNISPERIRQLAEHYRDVGVKGLYVGGSSGECIYQTVEERKIVLEEVVNAVGDDMTIIAHVAAPSTHNSIELAQHAESLGKVDALAAIPPLYYRLPDHAVESYWMSIIRSTELNFIIYNIPSTTGYELSPDMYDKMLEDPRVIGIKNSSIPVQDIYEFRKIQSHESIIFNGADEQFIAGRMMGADGGIGGTYGVMPELFMELDQLFKECKLEEAQELQYDINEVIAKITSGHGSMYDIIKHVIKINDGIELGSVREPLPRVNGDDEERIEEIASLIKKYEAKYLRKVLA